MDFALKCLKDFFFYKKHKNERISRHVTVGNLWFQLFNSTGLLVILCTHGHYEEVIWVDRIGKISAIQWFLTSFMQCILCTATLFNSNIRFGSCSASETWDNFAYLLVGLRYVLLLSGIMQITFSKYSGNDLCSASNYEEVPSLKFMAINAFQTFVLAQTLYTPHWSARLCVVETMHALCMSYCMNQKLLGINATFVFFITAAAGFALNVLAYNDNKILRNFIHERSRRILYDDMSRQSVRRELRVPIEQTEKAISTMKKLVGNSSSIEFIACREVEKSLAEIKNIVESAQEIEIWENRKARINLVGSSTVDIPRQFKQIVVQPFDIKDGSISSWFEYTIAPEITFFDINLPLLTIVFFHIYLVASSICISKDKHQRDGKEVSQDDESASRDNDKEYIKIMLSSVVSDDQSVYNRVLKLCICVEWYSLAKHESVWRTLQTLLKMHHGSLTTRYRSNANYLYLEIPCLRASVEVIEPGIFNSLAHSKYFGDSYACILDTISAPLIPVIMNNFAPYGFECYTISRLSECSRKGILFIDEESKNLYYDKIMTLSCMVVVVKDDETISGAALTHPEEIREVEMVKSRESNINGGTRIPFDSMDDQSKTEFCTLSPRMIDQYRQISEKYQMFWSINNLSSEFTETNAKQYDFFQFMFPDLRTAYNVDVVGFKGYRDKKYDYVSRFWAINMFSALVEAEYCAFRLGGYENRGKIKVYSTLILIDLSMCVILLYYIIMGALLISGTSRHDGFTQTVWLNFGKLSLCIAEVMVPLFRNRICNYFETTPCVLWLNISVFYLISSGLSSSISIVMNCVGSHIERPGYIMLLAVRFGSLLFLNWPLNVYSTLLSSIEVFALLTGYISFSCRKNIDGTPLIPFIVVNSSGIYEALCDSNDVQRTVIVFLLVVGHCIVFLGVMYRLEYKHRHMFHLMMTNEKIKESSVKFTDDINSDMEIPLQCIASKRRTIMECIRDERFNRIQAYRMKPIAYREKMGKNEGPDDRKMAETEIEIFKELSQVNLAFQINQMFRDRNCATYMKEPCEIVLLEEELMSVTKDFENLYDPNIRIKINIIVDVELSIVSINLKAFRALVLQSIFQTIHGKRMEGRSFMQEVAIIVSTKDVSSPLQNSQSFDIKDYSSVDPEGNYQYISMRASSRVSGNSFGLECLGPHETMKIIVLDRGKLPSQATSSLGNVCSKIAKEAGGAYLSTSLNNYELQTAQILFFPFRAVNFHFDIVSTYRGDFVYATKVYNRLLDILNTRFLGGAAHSLTGSSRHHVLIFDTDEWRARKCANVMIMNDWKTFIITSIDELLRFEYIEDLDMVIIDNSANENLMREENYDSAEIMRYKGYSLAIIGLSSSIGHKNSSPFFTDSLVRPVLDSSMKAIESAALTTLLDKILLIKQPLSGGEDGMASDE